MVVNDFMKKTKIYIKVAAITALMVCILFSASSKTMDCALSKTSSVTSMLSLPNFSPISLPTVVLRSWNAGKQCMKTAFSPAFFMTAAFT